MQTVSITTQPSIEPVTASEAKLFMRVTTSADDALIADLITSARALAEEYTRRKFITTGLTLSLDEPPTLRNGQWWDGVREGSINELIGQADHIKLPFPPAITVTSITSYDVDNSAAVFDSANYRLDAQGGRVYLNSGAQWPVNLRDYDALNIVYTAGYGATAASVPAAIRHAIKIAVAAMYEDRTCFELPATARAALQPYRIMQEHANHGV